MADHGHETTGGSIQFIFGASHSADFKVKVEGELTAGQMRALAGWLMTEAEMLHVAAKNQAMQMEANRRIAVPGATLPRDMVKVG